jgi:hypothetical protein
MSAHHWAGYPTRSKEKKNSTLGKEQVRRGNRKETKGKTLQGEAEKRQK